MACLFSQKEQRLECHLLHFFLTALRNKLLHHRCRNLDESMTMRQAGEIYPHPQYDNGDTTILSNTGASMKTGQVNFDTGTLIL